VVHQAAQQFVIEQIDEGGDNWTVDADFYNGRARCEKVRAKWLIDAEGTRHGWSSLKCVPYSPAKHGRLDGPKPPKGDTTQGALVTEHIVIYAMMLIDGSGGVLMWSVGDPYFFSKAECDAAAKKKNEPTMEQDFKPQKEPQRGEVRCYPFNSTITHHRL
jgi:hypothetical protein